MKDSLREIMIRIYDSRIIDRLDELWSSVERLYKTKNTFIVDLLVRGIESAENEKANMKEMYESGNIFKELKRLTALLDRFVDIGYNHYKEGFVIGKENQTLISRLYHAVFQIAKEKGISITEYNDGFFDALPENFEYITESLIEEFKARENS
ncbi:MAG: hypothetical protein EOM50_22465 [Erysipelotrichia bacterium]|nr:hypothetical protein [Erysipelotrichia bacterium]